MFHLHCSLPDGRDAVADYRDPITARMHAVYRARAMGQLPDPDDLAAVTAWLNANIEQVDKCARGECDHAA